MEPANYSSPARPMTREEKQERRAQMIQELRDGSSPEAVAQRYKMHPVYIRKIAREAGLSGKALRELRIRERNRRIALDLVRGTSQTEAARKYGLGRSWIAQIAQTEGVQSQDVHPGRNARIRAERAQGRSTAEIAEEYRLTPRQVRRIVQR